MTKALILDLGYVCVYPTHGHWRIPANYLDILGDKASTVFSHRFSTACQQLAHIMDEGALIADEQAEFAVNAAFYAALNQRMGWQLAEEKTLQLARSAVWNLDRYTFYPDVMPFISHLKGKLKLGILSDAMPSVKTLMKKSGMAAYLDAAVISTEIGTLKPDARMYIAIADRLGTDMRSCVFVDDKPENLLGAQALGMRAVQMLRHNTCPPAGEQRTAPETWNGPVIKNLYELEALL